MNPREDNTAWRAANIFKARVEGFQKAIEEEDVWRNMTAEALLTILQSMQAFSSRLAVELLKRGVAHKVVSDAIGIKLP